MTLLAPPRDDRTRRQRQQRRSPIVALILIMALAITMVGIFPFRQIIAQHRQVDLTQEKLDALSEENARLEQQVDLLQTDAELERIAREEFGLVRKGEVAYTVTTPGDDPPITSLSTGPVVVDREGSGRGFFQRVWDFLTGRDLVPDE